MLNKAAFILSKYCKNRNIVKYYYIYEYFFLYSCDVNLNFQQALSSV